MRLSGLLAATSRSVKTSKHSARVRRSPFSAPDCRSIPYQLWKTPIAPAMAGSSLQVDVDGYSHPSPQLKYWHVLHTSLDEVARKHWSHARKQHRRVGAHASGVIVPRIFFNSCQVNDHRRLCAFWIALKLRVQERLMFPASACSIPLSYGCVLIDDRPNYGFRTRNMEVCIAPNALIEMNGDINGTAMRASGCEGVERQGLRCLDESCWSLPMSRESAVRLRRRGPQGHLRHGTCLPRCGSPARFWHPALGG